MPDSAFTYDISQLEKMLAEMSSSERRKALRGSMRAAGRKVKKEAERTAGTKMKPSKKIGKGIRVVVFKKKLGFRVTVAPANRKKKTGLALYMETGTKTRYYYIRKSKKTGERSLLKKRKSTGVFAPRPFMEETKNRVAPGITQQISNSVIEHMQKIARRYGCK